MTQRQRSAIIHYWLSKNWFDLGHGSMRRLTRRFFAFILAVMIASPAFAAEPKLVNKASKAVKAIQQEKTDNLKAAETKALKEKPAFPKEAKTTTKAVTGTVVSTRKYSISLQTGESETEGALEILIRTDAATKVKGVKNISDLKYGDRVKVSYSYTVLPAKEKDGEAKLLDSTATLVELLMTAPAMAPPTVTIVEPPAAPAGAGRAK